MDENLLLKSAKELNQVSQTAAEEYAKKADQLAAIMNETMENREDMVSIVGESNIDMMKDNHANHVRFISSILKFKNDQVLVSTILWVYRAYRSRGFTTSYWAVQLNTWIKILNQTLSAECYKEVYPYYEWMLINIPIFVKLTDKDLISNN